MAAAPARPPPVLDDPQECIAAAARGDESAFTTLYERHARQVYNLVLRSVRDPQAAEDVCQEVWVKAYRQLPGLREPAAFRTWLYRIAARACVDRARRAPPVPHGELSGDFPGNDGGPEEETIRHEEERLVWEALSTLPVRQHLSLFLREVEGRNYREIAGIMGTSESAVETLLFRARRGIVEAYAQLGTENGERCKRVQKTMACLLDGEATPVQQRAVAAHAGYCAACRAELERMREASRVYCALPLVPVSIFAGGRVLETAGSGASATGLAKLLALVLTKSKLVATTATLTGGLTIAALVTPEDAPLTTSASALAQVASATQPGSTDGTDAGLLEAFERAARDAVLPGGAGDAPGPAAGSDPLDGLSSVPLPLAPPVLTGGDVLDGALDAAPDAPQLPLPQAPADPAGLPLPPLPAPLSTEELAPEEPVLDVPILDLPLIDDPPLDVDEPVPLPALP
jgi:RNA polymerase sigma-70 factor (ECF subfamily)